MQNKKDFKVPKLDKKPSINVNSPKVDAPKKAAEKPETLKKVNSSSTISNSQKSVVNKPSTITPSSPKVETGKTATKPLGSSPTTKPIQSPTSTNKLNLTGRIGTESKSTTNGSMSAREKTKPGTTSTLKSKPSMTSSR